MEVTVIVKMVPAAKVPVTNPLKFSVTAVVAVLLVLVIETVVLAPPVLNV
jgi:hypothetical protein